MFDEWVRWGIDILVPWKLRLVIVELRLLRCKKRACSEGQFKGDLLSRVSFRSFSFWPCFWLNAPKIENVLFLLFSASIWQWQGAYSHGRLSWNTSSVRRENFTKNTAKNRAKISNKILLKGKSTFCARELVFILIEM